MQKDSKVSIILPNFNSYPYIKDAVNSILNQSHKNWELIIIDDASNSITKNYLKKIYKNKKIKIFYLKKNKGAGYCRNLGIKNSKSKYIAFIDSDDIWKKDKLKLQTNFMSKNKFKFTYTQYSSFKNSKKKFIKSIIPPNKINAKNFIRNTSIGTSTMIIEKKLIKNIKFSQTPILEDYFFKYQILKKAKFAICYKKNLTYYRIRKDSLQSNKFKNIYWLWFINRKYIKLDILKNFLSVISISINSFKKYGFK